MDKMRREEHESSKGMEGAFEKDSERLAMNINTQAGLHL